MNAVYFICTIFEIILKNNMINNKKLKQTNEL